MVRLSTAALLGVAAFASAAYAEALVQDCGEDLGNCPSNKPCCSRMHTYTLNSSHDVIR